jgi:hypothetical protein
MRTRNYVTTAAERLAALIELAAEHDDDLNYAEVEELLAASRRRLAIREPRPSRTAQDAPART